MVVMLKAPDASVEGADHRPLDSLGSFTIVYDGSVEEISDVMDKSTFVDQRRVA